MSQKYKIVRNYFRGRSRVIKRGLTLVEAQEYCRDPQTTSETATGTAARRRTERYGRWFDGYDRDSK